MIAAEVAVIIAVTVLVVMFAPTPLAAVLVCAATIVVLYGCPHVVTAALDWWQRKAAASEQRLAVAAARRTAPAAGIAALPSAPRRDAETVPAPDVLPRQGRHRRDEAGPDAVSATGILRRLDATAVERHRQMLERAGQ